MTALKIEDQSAGICDFPMAFSPQEYADRRRKVQSEMRRLGIDTLFVSSPPNLTYLTGYDSRWYRRFRPTGLAINVDSDDILFFDDESHRGLVALFSGQISRAAFFERFPNMAEEGWIYKPTARDVTETIKNEGWLKGVAAVERWALAPGGLSLRFIEEGFQAAGARTLDGSWLVDRVRLIKSPAEIAIMEQAAAIADAAIEAIVRDFQAGMTEIEVQGIAHYAMSKLGGEEPALRTGNPSGTNQRAHHLPPTRRKVQKGDLFGINLCGSYYRYHADLARTFSVGEPDERWTELVETTRISFERVVDEVRPGDPMEKVVEVAQGYFEAVGIALRTDIQGWAVGGYDMGIAIPPDWVGHTYLNGRCFERADLVPGTAINFENVFDIKEGWPGGFQMANIDTLVMEASGLRILSKLDRGIHIIGC